eukprot:scaffold2539_cov388-Prasinococcus_capsulatus_cf.AAC.5
MVSSTRSVHPAARGILGDGRPAGGAAGAPGTHAAERAPHGARADGCAASSASASAAPAAPEARSAAARPSCAALPAIRPRMLGEVPAAGRWGAHAGASREMMMIMRRPHSGGLPGRGRRGRKFPHQE